MVTSDIQLKIADEFFKESKKIHAGCLTLLERLEKNDAIVDDFEDLFGMYDVMATSSRSANLCHCEIYFRAIAEYCRFLSQSIIGNIEQRYLQPLRDSQKIIQKCYSEIHEHKILDDKLLIKHLSDLVKLMANCSSFSQGS